MRKFALFMMFSLVCFSLYGQTAREPKIYVAPIEGFGREADNDYIYKRLIYEIILQYHTTVKSKYDSDYTFKGTIGLVSEMPGEGAGELVVINQEDYNPVPDSPIPPINNVYGRREFFSMKTGDELFFFDSTGADNIFLTSSDQKTPSSETNDQEEGEGYYFKLEMIDNRTGEAVGVQNFIFITTGASVNKLISTAVYNLLSDIPDVPSKRGDSRDRWLYFEMSALWMPRLYYGGYESLDLLGFGMKLGMELHFLSFMSLGAGMQITQEQIVASGETVTSLIFETPVSLKLVFKLGDNYALEPYGGASWNYALVNKIQPSMFSWFAGVQFGIKDKSETGMLVFDARFAMDFYDSVIADENIQYQRYCVQLGVGYKFGAIQKRTKVN